MKKQQKNAVKANFRKLTDLYLFIKFEKVEKKEIWQIDIVQKTLVLPLYLYINAKESYHVQSCEKLIVTPPPHALRTDDLDLLEIKIAKN